MANALAVDSDDTTRAEKVLARDSNAVQSTVFPEWKKIGALLAREKLVVWVAGGVPQLAHRRRGASRPGQGRGLSLSSRGRTRDPCLRCLASPSRPGSLTWRGTQAAEQGA